MKNKLLKSLFALLLIPVLFFAGCKDKKSLPAIDLATYLKEEITVSYYQLEAKSTKDLSFITDTKLDEEKLGKYVKFELSANSVWMYKMFVESISFYVYTTDQHRTVEKLCHIPSRYRLVSGYRHIGKLKNS